MTAIVNVIEIDRPPAEVYAVATDPTRFAEWQSDVVGATVDGARFTTTRRVGGVERGMTQEVTDDRPPLHWAARGVDGPIRPHATVTVEPLDGGARSRVTFTLDFDPHGIGVAIAPVARRQARKAAPVSYRTLKALLENG